MLLGAKFDFLLITDCRCLEQSNKSNKIATVSRRGYRCSFKSFLVCLARSRRRSTGYIPRCSVVLRMSLICKKRAGPKSTCDVKRTVLISISHYSCHHPTYSRYVEPRPVTSGLGLQWTTWPWRLAPSSQPGRPRAALTAAPSPPAAPSRHRSLAPAL